MIHSLITGYIVILVSVTFCCEIDASCCLSCVRYILLHIRVYTSIFHINCVIFLCSGLNVGAFVGIVIGALIGLLLVAAIVALVVWWCCCRPDSGECTQCVVQIEFSLQTPSHLHAGAQQSDSKCLVFSYNQLSPLLLTLAQCMLRWDQLFSSRLRPTLPMAQSGRKQQLNSLRWKGTLPMVLSDAEQAAQCCTYTQYTCIPFCI